MPPRIPSLTRIACTLALLLAACTKAEREPTTPPSSTATTSTAGGAGGQCLPGGPSVSVTIRGRAGGDDMPNDELGVLLGWIGGFAQPCREATPEATRFSLEIQLGAAGEEPALVLVERDALPGLAACLDETFAKAPPPPPGPMKVQIVIPWGCSTLGPGFQAEPEPAAPAATP